MYPGSRHDIRSELCARSPSTVYSGCPQRGSSAFPALSTKVNTNRSLFKLYMKNGDASGYTLDDIGLMARELKNRNGGERALAALRPRPGILCVVLGISHR